MDSHIDDIWFEAPEQNQAGIPANPYYAGDSPDPVVLLLGRVPGTDRFGQVVPNSEWNEDTGTLTYKCWRFTPQTIQAMQNALNNTRQSGKTVKTLIVWMHEGEKQNPNLMTKFRQWGFVKDSLAGGIMTFTKDMTRKPEPQRKPEPEKEKPKPMKPLSLWEQELRDIKASISKSIQYGIHVSDAERTRERWLESQIKQSVEREQDPKQMELTRQIAELQKRIAELQKSR